MINSIKIGFVVLLSILMEYLCYRHITEDTMKLHENITRIHEIIDANKPKQEKDSFDVILMCGWDNTKVPSYKTCGEQMALIKQGLGDKKVVSKTYTNISGIKESIKENPNAYVVLFSAGGAYSNVVANIIKDKTKLYILQPAHRTAVQDAVSSGVPAENVIEGPTKGTGKDFVSGATKTPKGYDHFGSLKFAGILVRQRLNQ